MICSPKLLLVVLLVLTANQGARGEKSISVLSRPDVSQRNPNYLSNRAPLAPNALIKLPIGAVQARGWLLETLLRQQNGLTGKLPEVSAWLEKEGNAWLSADGRGKWGWEEVPYWLRGAIRLGQLLEDQQLIDETEVWLSAVFDGQRANGHFGPLRVFGDDDSHDLWANMVMLSCLQTYYEYSQDQRVIELMTKYFRFQSAIPDEEMFTHFWQYYRAGDNLESIYWLYNQTGEPWLLDLAAKVHRNTANWRSRGDLPNWHSVNVAQAFGEPATYYLQSRDPNDLQAAYQNFAMVRRRYGQVPGGMFGADENARVGYDDPRQAIETCAVVEQMTSNEMLLGITGDPFWADHTEEVAFNTLPAAFNSDYRALRYLTSPNLVTSDGQDHAPGVENIGPMFVMNPLSHRCCQHNHSQAWPRFVEHLWMATPDDGLCAVHYGPSVVKGVVGEKVETQIEAVTRYPFEEQIAFKITVAEATSFPLYLRIPKWCTRSVIMVNGASVAENMAPSNYVRIYREWQSGDEVTLMLPMDLAVRRWEKNHNSISVDRGPLTYSLKIEAQTVAADPIETAAQDSQWQESVDSAAWPAVEIFPATPWNFGLVLKEADPAQSFEVKQLSWPADNDPFAADSVPIELVCSARQIPGWDVDLTGLCAPLQDSPVYSNSPEQRINLIPMGAALLRISAFPEVQNDRNLPRWQTASQVELAFEPTASYCHQDDTVDAMADGLEPCASNDRGIPRLSFLPHAGGVEWLQANFDAPRTIDQVRIYWCDDVSRYDHAPTGPFKNILTQGKCRVPKAWQLLYRDQGDWKKVAAQQSHTVHVNQYNTLNFQAVTTTALRVEVEQADDSSSGVLEWQISQQR
ncbi:MAG: beta-L-arabinofuranosidase domain-containing protein [Bythopirellula sp.]